MTTSASRLLNRLQSAVWRLDQHLTRPAPGGWVDDVRDLDRIREIRTSLQSLEAYLERRVSQAWKGEGIYDSQVVDGVGVVDVHTGADRKQWAHDQLAKEVVERHLEQAAGEIPGPWDVRDWLMAAVGVSYWRVKVLKGLGITVDDYCTKVPGKVSVQITKPSSPQPVGGGTADRQGPADTNPQETP